MSSFIENLPKPYERKDKSKAEGAWIHESKRATYRCRQLGGGRIELVVKSNRYADDDRAVGTVVEAKGYDGLKAVDVEWEPPKKAVRAEA